MTKSNSETPSRMEQILDLLLDALLERQQSRQGRDPRPPEPPAIPEPVMVEPPPQLEPEPELIVEEPALAEFETFEEILPPPAHAGQTGRLIFRLAVGLFLLILLVNVPINRHGVSLARVLPDSAALIIRDGLLLKGETNDEVYVLQDDKLRWISSMEAFDRLGYRWKDVHEVEESFFDKFEKGQPLHVLLKCDSSPHIYRIEREQKRWIKDILTFESEGHIWQDVRFVSCRYLREIPDGPPIPEDAGPPPQP